MLAVLVCGSVYGDDLFRTSSCGVNRVEPSYRLSPAPALGSAPLNGCGGRVQTPILPGGMVPLCPTCPLRAGEVSYAPLSINIPNLEYMVHQIEMIPNYQYYPCLAEAVYGLKCTIIRAKANSRVQ